MSLLFCCCFRSLIDQDGERSSYVDRGGPIGVSAVFATASGFDDADDCCIVSTRGRVRILSTAFYAASGRFIVCRTKDRATLGETRLQPIVNPPQGCGGIF